MTNSKSRPAFYSVYLVTDDDVDELPGEFDSYYLARSLYLVRSNSTQSRLYHDLKNRLNPTKLFVGKLSEDPKFKGLEDGSLKWVRQRRDKTL